MKTGSPVRLWMAFWAFCRLLPIMSGIVHSCGAVVVVAVAPGDVSVVPDRVPSWQPARSTAAPRTMAARADRGVRTDFLRGSWAYDATAEVPTRDVESPSYNAA